MSDGADGDDRHLEEEVIDGIYETAMDPSRYEELLDRWQNLLLRRQMRGDGEDLPGVAPHVMRAGQTLDRVMEAEAKSAGALLTTIHHNAAFVIDETLVVTAANRASAASLGLAVGARLSDLGRLVAEPEPLIAAARQALRRNDATPHILRLHGSRTGKTVLVSFRRYAGPSGTPELLAVTSELAWPPAFGEVVRATFDLTVAETEVMRALSEGSSLADIASARGRSVATVRAQLKSVMSKTETSSQADLIRLTLSMLEIARFSDPGSVALQGDAPAHSADGGLVPRPIQRMSLPDGRLMEYLILGDPKGRPCLYMPIDFGLTRWPASAEAEASRAGIRIIVPIRAGYGQSSALPEGVDVLRQLADDHVALLDRLGAPRLPIIAMGDDSLLAFAIHTAAPERVSAIICCAGVLPLTGPEQFDRMGRWHRFVIAGARTTPHLLPFMVQAGAALARRIGKSGFLESVYRQSAADRATFQVPEVLEAITVGSEVALSKTHVADKAFTRELIAKVNFDWQEDVAFTRGRLPVHFLSGLQDPQVPSETLEEHQQSYPWIDFRIFPDAGQLLFFLKWREVLPLILRHLHEAS
ncbi:LuxR C-terminal-related transcriptional regulator [Pseudoroseicyclus tamaricis]|uniref:Helix-turn-helix transcriptional regulator n=1 Tax=Pseudoroseicyclus tamaricis TaxID=2705421 RepID=A0A6B2JJT5_9RHOB|nr:LuxR C-terminal-related transcriptional regulator [Pseudoroseicyclus tamaricis]NDV01703.1 helix-turn-helix transcriptional regulator [Pseudoroseicyclus tamaricis]